MPFRRLWLLLLLSGTLTLMACPAASDDDDVTADDDDATADDDDATADDDDATADDDDSTADDDDATADDDDSAADDDDSTADDDDSTADDDDSLADDDDSLADDDDSLADDDDSVADDDDSVADDDDSVADDDDSVADDDDSVADDDDSAVVTLDWVELAPSSFSGTTREAASFVVTAHYSDSSSIVVTHSIDVSWSTTVASGAPAPIFTSFELSSALSGELEVIATVGGVPSAAASVDFAAAPVEPGDFVVNELLADGTAGDANGDGFTDANEDAFVEFVNISSIELDLAGVRVFDYDLDLTTSPRHTFGVGDFSLPGEALVLFGGGTPMAAPVGSVYYTADNAADPGIPLLLALNPMGDAIRMRQSDDALIAQIEFGTVAGGTPDANIDESINLDPDVVGTTYAPHSTLNGDPLVVFSPGLRVDLTPF